MKRLIEPVLRRCLAVACVASCLASSALADNVSFSTRPRYNGIPGAGSNIVVYNLPASGSVYAGPVDGSFDLVARVDGDGVETAAGFGLIANIGGAGEVVFDPPEIINDENNLVHAQNTAFDSNTSFDFLFASTGIQGGGLQEIDITAFEEIALQNNTINDGEGLVSVPFQVGAGVTGNFNVNFNVSGNYTGFVKTLGVNDTEFLTNAGAFPHVGTTIEVRQSRKGDLNGDGNVNAADIGGFIAALNNLGTFSSQFPWLQAAYISDINEDMNTNAADIGGFINVLNNPGGSPAAVPEPTTLAMACIGAAGLAFRLVRRRQGRR